MNRHRRCKVVWITPELIQEMLTVGNRIRVEVEQGLPEGAVYTRAYYDEAWGNIGLIFYHPDFEPNVEGPVGAGIDVVFRTLDDE